jgi:phytoene/squalene synthetase
MSGGLRASAQRAMRGALDTTTLAAAMTRAASKQTYYTIRLLVEPERRHAAFCAYSYFRWVDDVLDAQDRRPLEEARGERVAFLARQQALLDRGLRGALRVGLSGHEAMLIDLLQADPRGGPRAALETYLRQMMRVMEFDVRRRGRLVSASELEQYTAWLATAVTEAMHYFLGDGTYEPRDETRYLAVTGAHILHMLRDTYPDLETGYFNVPREVLAAGGIRPTDVDTDAYRAWVGERANLARACLDAGRAFFNEVHSWRHRLAGLAYIARFEWLIGQLEQDRYLVRQDYTKPGHVATAFRVGRQAVWHPRGGTGERIPA